MDDIVERLRDAASQGMDMYGIHCDVEIEAAREIERLRALIIELEEQLHIERVNLPIED